MSDPEIRRNLLAGAGVMALAALALVAGTVGRPASPRAEQMAGDPTPLAHGAASPRDPQPEVVIQHVAFSLAPPLETPEVAALLGLLGGTDPALAGLTLADPGLDDLSIQGAIRRVPGAQVHGVMGVITRGGESAGIGVEMTTTDPATGLTTGRREVVVLTSVTVLDDGRLAVSATLRDEDDSTALAVLGRRVGVPLGRTGEAGGALILDPGETAAIRLPGRELNVVFLQIRARSAPAQPADPGSPRAGDPGTRAPGTGGG